MRSVDVFLVLNLCSQTVLLISVFKKYEGRLKSKFPIIRKKKKQRRTTPKTVRKCILHLKLFSISLYNFQKDLGTYCNGERVFRFVHGIPQHPNL